MNTKGKKQPVFLVETVASLPFGKCPIEGCACRSQNDIYHCILCPSQRFSPSTKSVMLKHYQEHWQCKLPYYCSKTKKVLMLLQCLHECNGYKRVTAGQEEPHFHCPECKMSSANKKEVVMHIMDHASQKSHEAITELAQYNADGQKLNEQIPATKSTVEAEPSGSLQDVHLSKKTNAKSTTQTKKRTSVIKYSKASEPFKSLSAYRRRKLMINMLIVKDYDDIIVSECDGRHRCKCKAFHCPYCPKDWYKPSSKGMAEQHVKEIHWSTRVGFTHPDHQGQEGQVHYTILCHQHCDRDRFVWRNAFGYLPEPHYHCPICEHTENNLTYLIKHLKTLHRDLRVTRKPNGNSALPCPFKVINLDKYKNPQAKDMKTNCIPLKMADTPRRRGKNPSSIMTDLKSFNHWPMSVNTKKATCDPIPCTEPMASVGEGTMEENGNLIEEEVTFTANPSDLEIVDQSALSKSVTKQIVENEMSEITPTEIGKPPQKKSSKKSKKHKHPVFEMMAAVIDPEVIDLFPENAEGFLDELCKKTGITHSFSGMTCMFRGSFEGIMEAQNIIKDLLIDVSDDEGNVDQESIEVLDEDDEDTMLVDCSHEDMYNMDQVCVSTDELTSTTQDKFNVHERDVLDIFTDTSMSQDVLVIERATNPETPVGPSQEQSALDSIGTSSEVTRNGTEEEIHEIRDIESDVEVSGREKSSTASAVQEKMGSSIVVENEPETLQMIDCNKQVEFNDPSPLRKTLKRKSKSPNGDVRCSYENKLADKSINISKESSEENNHKTLRDTSAPRKNCRKRRNYVEENMTALLQSDSIAGKSRNKNVQSENVQHTTSHTESANLHLPKGKNDTSSMDSSPQLKKARIESAKRTQVNLKTSQLGNAIQTLGYIETEPLHLQKKDKEGESGIEKILKALTPSDLNNEQVNMPTENHLNDLQNISNNKSRTVPLSDEMDLTVSVDNSDQSSLKKNTKDGDTKPENKQKHIKPKTKHQRKFIQPFTSEIHNYVRRKAAIKATAMFDNRRRMSSLKTTVTVPHVKTTSTKIAFSHSEDFSKNVTNMQDEGHTSKYMVLEQHSGTGNEVQQNSVQSQLYQMANNESTKVMQCEKRAAQQSSTSPNVITLQGKKLHEVHKDLKQVRISLFDIHTASPKKAEDVKSMADLRNHKRSLGHEDVPSSSSKEKVSSMSAIHHSTSSRLQATDVKDSLRKALNRPDHSRNDQMKSVGDEATGTSTMCYIKGMKKSKASPVEKRIVFHDSFQKIPKRNTRSTHHLREIKSIDGEASRKKDARKSAQSKIDSELSKKVETNTRKINAKKILKDASPMSLSSSAKDDKTCNTRQLTSPSKQSKVLSGTVDKEENMLQIVIDSVGIDSSNHGKDMVTDSNDAVPQNKNQFSVVQISKTILDCNYSAETSYVKSNLNTGSQSIRKDTDTNVEQNILHYTDYQEINNEQVNSPDDLKSTQQVKKDGVAVVKTLDSNVSKASNNIRDKNFEKDKSMSLSTLTYPLIRSRLSPPKKDDIYNVKSPTEPPMVSHKSSKSEKNNFSSERDIETLTINEKSTINVQNQPRRSNRSGVASKMDLIISSLLPKVQTKGSKRKSESSKSLQSHDEIEITHLDENSGCSNAVTASLNTYEVLKTSSGKKSIPYELVEEQVNKKMPIKVKSVEKQKVNKLISCPKCNKQFSSLTSMNRHFGKIHSSEIPSDIKKIQETSLCPHCNLEFPKAKLQFHILATHDINKNASARQCLHCNLESTSGEALKDHIDRVHIISCPKCKKVALNKIEADKHLQNCQTISVNVEVHNNAEDVTENKKKEENPSNCEKCVLGFSPDDEIKTDQLLLCIHNCIVKYKCHICDFSTTDGGVIAKHQKRHQILHLAKSMIIKGEGSTEGFGSKSVTTNAAHITYGDTSWNIEIFLCHLCDRFCADENSLRQHTQECHHI